MGERVESQGFYEMLWDCDHCEAKGLLAKSQRHCPECGAPQSALKRYFPSPEQQKKVDGHVYEGADRNCPACNAPMGAKAKNCTQCGSPMDGSKIVEGVKPQAPPPPAKKRAVWPYIVGGIVLVIFLIWFFFLRTKNAQLEVVAHHWTRSIAVEEFKEVEESAWRNEAAKDGVGMRCISKQRSSKQVADGEECHIEKHDKKDGTFEQVNVCKTKYRSEAINDDWCTYTVRRWKKVDEVVAKGDGLSPAWPATAPAADNLPILGNKRSGAKTEKLILDFGKRGSCDVPESTWGAISDGQKVKLEVRARSGDLVCDTIKAK